MGVDRAFQEWLSAVFRRTGGSGSSSGKAAMVMDATAIAAASADWAGWQRRAFHDAWDWDWNWISSSVDEARLRRAAWFSLTVCGALVLSHLATVAVIAHYDLSGKWDQYSLKYQRSTWRTYAQHAQSFFADVAFLLGPALVAFGYIYDAPLFEPLCLHGRPARDALRLTALALAAVLNNVINRLWAMGVHWAMHESKWLYRAVHKRHHCRIRDLCALSAWQDTTLEFILMEVLGVFLFAQLFNPVPWHFHVLLAAYNGVGGAIDHSAFYIPGTVIDGRYHWDHHLRMDYNYSEIEFLDRIFGTLYSRPEPHHAAHAAAAAAVSPRLRKRPRASAERREEEEQEGPQLRRPVLMIQESGETPREREKAAQSPPRVTGGPRAGEAGGTAGAGDGVGGRMETRQARPYS